MDGGAVRREHRARRRPRRGSDPRVGVASSSRTSSSPKPKRRASATAASRRRSCAALRATVTVPPLWNCGVVADRGAARREPPTSSTVSIIARCQAIAARRGRGAVARPVRLDRQQRRAPAAVAAAGAEPDVVTLDDDDAQRRVGLEQRQRRPQPGVAGADDRDVDVEVAVERGRRRTDVGRAGRRPQASGAAQASPPTLRR